MQVCQRCGVHLIDPSSAALWSHAPQRGSLTRSAPPNPIRPACLPCSRGTTSRRAPLRPTAKPSSIGSSMGGRVWCRSGARKSGSKRRRWRWWCASTLALTRPTSSRSRPARGWSAGWTHCPCRHPRHWTPLVRMLRPKSAWPELALGLAALQCSGRASGQAGGWWLCIRACVVVYEDGQTRIVEGVGAGSELGHASPVRQVSTAVVVVQPCGIFRQASGLHDSNI